MHERSTLQAREHGRIDLLRDGFVVGHDHAAARAAQCFVRGGRHDVGMPERRGMNATRHQSSEMGHVDHEDRAHLVSNRAEPCEVDFARISRSARNDECRLILDGQCFDGIVIDQVCRLIDAILHSVIPFAGKRWLRAMGQVTAGIERETHDRVTRLGQCQHYRAVRLRARMRLHVDETATEQLLGPVDGELLDGI